MKLLFLGFLIFYIFFSKGYLVDVKNELNFITINRLGIIIDLRIVLQRFIDNRNIFLLNILISFILFNIYVFVVFSLCFFVNVV